MTRFYSKTVHTDSGKIRENKSVGNVRVRPPLPERAYLSQFRVIQRDLVYVIGIPIDIAQEDTLCKYEYFGQYGQIKKVVVNNQTMHTSSYQQKPTVSAYVTFQNIEDAWECIYAFETFQMNGHQLKASFGTSKYCSSFLSGQKCTKSDCMYLHHEGDPKDSFSQEEIQQNSDRFLEMTRPPRPDDYYDYQFQDSKPVVFPPRRILTKKKPQENVLPKQQNQAAQQQQAPQQTQKVEAAPNNLFVSSLFSHETIRPLKVSYTIGASLTDQLFLNRPSIRSVIDGRNNQ